MLSYQRIGPHGCGGGGSTVLVISAQYRPPPEEKHNRLVLPEPRNLAKCWLPCTIHTQKGYCVLVPLGVPFILLQNHSRASPTSRKPLRPFLSSLTPFRAASDTDDNEAFATFGLDGHARGRSGSKLCSLSPLIHQHLRELEVSDIPGGGMKGAADASASGDTAHTVACHYRRRRDAEPGVAGC
jgi:hypothetical protein